MINVYVTWQFTTNNSSDNNASFKINILIIAVDNQRFYYCNNINVIVIVIVIVIVLLLLLLLFCYFYSVLTQWCCVIVLRYSVAFN